ncbi:MAG: hypothetical protein RBU30_17715 [Polyangia bacterium]|jgi:predicted Zn-ribbon and HTH transcriptional regulator|nr:hypothetical protein [Polyangia bacterium]
MKPRLLPPRCPRCGRTFGRPEPMNTPLRLCPTCKAELKQVTLAFEVCR